jgi:UDPglucose--hexose-1-phosphate uridylyltransferase
LFARTIGEGHHEVIIESPDHVRAFTALTPAQSALVARVWRDRLAMAAADPRIGYALIFRNHGRMAGASREHVHSQLLASPAVPSGIAVTLDNARAHHAATGRCIWCDVIAAETAGAAPRLIAQDELTVTLAAFAPRFAYEAWILPRRHAHDYGAANDATCEALARALASLLHRLNRVMGDVPFNMGLQTAPRGADAASTHWRAEVYPRLHHLAGYEWGSGSAIVSVTPEDAAAQLRSAP